MNYFKQGDYWSFYNSAANCNKHDTKAGRRNERLERESNQAPMQN